ncbi:uncharacterized protein N7458_002240 [Penicillium daleae]|uniref:Uncharacterized protein n=1 Tax=Penicillium daleae TaxID=63821 RepID=A0AAD6G6Y7_9EURO|nr:uncharacterized protein N7458_002240 [Penicillium daleae]KAJ5460688.1 hypothetical protein N7458_002240 [Penicillium daleae]
MLLSFGLEGVDAVAHTNEPGTQPESLLASNSPSSSAFSLPTLPCLGTLYNRNKQSDSPVPPAQTVSAAAQIPVTSTPSELESSQAASLAIARPLVFHSYTYKTSRPKISYQFAYPVVHTWHKRLRLRPKLLLQVQQVSHMARPLPILEVQQSTLYLPRFTRKFPTMFCPKNGQGPNDLSVVRSELYTRTVASITEKNISCEREDNADQRQVVATIVRVPQEDGDLKGKAEICLNFGPVWEVTPLPSGSYEFVARTENGVRVVRWALRGGRNRRASATPGTQPRNDTKRFTFSIIDLNARRHPVIASMNKNLLEVYNEYSVVVPPSTSQISQSLGMSVASDLSDNEALVDNKNVVTLDDGLRTLILITGIWVACWEGWS